MDKKIYEAGKFGICPYCNAITRFISVMDETGKDNHEVTGNEEKVIIRFSACSKCQKPIITIMAERKDKKDLWLVYPTSSYMNLPGQLPEDIKKDIVEANQTLRYSERASAALSRSALKKIMEDKGAPVELNLLEQLKWLLKKRAPHHISEILNQTIKISGLDDADKRKYPDRILGINPGEAELLLDAIRAIISHYYIKQKEAEKIIKLMKE